MDDKVSLETLKKKIQLLEDALQKKQNEFDKLKKKQQLLFQIFQEGSIPTFVIDSNHIITHYNKALEELTGIPGERLIGTKNQWRAFYKEKRPVMADLLVNGASEEEIRRYYKTYYHHSNLSPGTYEAEGFFEALGEAGKWLFFTATPLKNESGEIIGGIETLQDISDRKKAENKVRQSESRYKSLLDFSPYPIVVYDLKWNPIYLNSAFTNTFGWTFKEAKGKQIPFSPKGIETLNGDDISKLNDGQGLKRQITKRLTKDGKIRDVVLRVATFLNSRNEPAGQLVIFRDITHEKKLSRDNEAILRISVALPWYRDLDQLLDYISEEVKNLLGTEGALVILKDEETGELYFKGASYDDRTVSHKVKRVRFSFDQIVAGKVIESGEPVIINDTNAEKDVFPERDVKLGYHTRNLIEVPLRGKTNIIGVLAAINKKEGIFDETDIRLLNMIASTVALSIENTSFSDALKKAFHELKSMNRAKDKAINHLSHELRTPVSTLTGVMELLEHELKILPIDSWQSTMEIAHRNLTRIVEIQEEVSDIMHSTHHVAHGLLHAMFNSCTDFLEVSLGKAHVGQDILNTVREHIDDHFGPKQDEMKSIKLDQIVRERIEFATLKSSHRAVQINTRLEEVSPLILPSESVRKIVDGLIKNAIENTPDEGEINVSVQQLSEGIELIVEDHGVGIIEDAQKRIFEGFFTTQDTMFYSTKRPYDFNAGGKGADLLRMKIFSERYQFTLKMNSVRCSHLPLESNVCPGRISQCSMKDAMNCCQRKSGTVFSVFFPKTAAS
ncbi:MAG: PAS domain S-box protein [Proteobacteria bacterium]|nr:PAS domain S-box protein [Pseudomonadota bacterium]